VDSLGIDNRLRENNGKEEAAIRNKNFSVFLRDFGRIAASSFLTTLRKLVIPKLINRWAHF